MTGLLHRFRIEAHPDQEALHSVRGTMGLLNAPENFEVRFVPRAE